MTPIEQTTEPRPRLRVGWLSGLVLGVAVGFAVLITGFIGMAIGAAALLVIIWKGPRSIALSGFVTGAGTLWTILFARVMSSCAAENLQPGQACGAADIGAFVAGSATIMVIGLAATLAVVLRSRTTRSP